MATMNHTFYEDNCVNFGPEEVGEIIEARYGQDDPIKAAPSYFIGGHGRAEMINVTDRIRSFLKQDGSLKFQVNNDNMGNDPCPYTPKLLYLKYKQFVKVKQEDIEEKFDCDYDEIYHNGKYAAYIAIDEYENIDNLKCCVNDALLLEKTLKSKGFITLGKMLKNKKATKSNIEKFLDDISHFLKDKRNSCFILYIAGHGGKINTREYFLCNDYSPDREISTAIKYEKIRDYVESFYSKHQLFLMDSCYSGKLIPTGLGLREKKWKNVFVNRPGLHAITSVKNSGRAIESGKNGIFTKCFVDSLNEGLASNEYIKITEIYDKIITKTKKEIKDLNIDFNEKYIPQLGRLCDKINSREKLDMMLEVNGELIFFKPLELPSNTRFKDGFGYEWSSDSSDESSDE